MVYKCVSEMCIYNHIRCLYNIYIHILRLSFNACSEINKNLSMGGDVQTKYIYLAITFITF